MSATKRNILIFLLMLVLLLVGTAWYLFRGDTAQLTTDQLSGPVPQLSAPREEKVPTINVAEIIGWKPGEKPLAAPGLQVERYVSGLDHPRNMLLLANGDVLVAEANSPPRENKGVEGFVMRNLMDKAGAGGASANRITLLRDSDKDGRVDIQQELVGGLNSPFGMVVQDDTLYVANTDAVVMFPFTPGTTKINKKPVKLISLNAQKPNNHWARNLLLSDDGKTLYVSVGSNSNIGENGMDSEFQRAGILEVDLATKKARVFATGLRNPVGMDFNPVTGELWTVVNERDMLGSDMVPDYMTSVPFGAQFGWPWIYWGDFEDLRVTPRRPELIDYVRRPDYGLGSHVAPLGLVFADKAKLGPKYAAGAFVARHGSWNRKPAAGYDVVFVPFDAKGKPAVVRNKANKVIGGLPMPVLTGFLTKDEDAHGRPTMVAIDGTGALLVSDDTAGIIWRVSAKP